MNLARMLVESARRTPHAPAVTWQDRVTTYAQLAARVSRLATGLGSLGVGAGARVAVLLRNRPELLESMFACFAGGLGWVPLNARFTASEVAYHVSDSGAAVVITDDEGLATVLEAGTAARVVVVEDAHTVVPDPCTAYDVVLAAGTPDADVVAVGRDDLAWLFYTSGTTGKPKGAMLTHGVLTFTTASWLADLTPLDHTDVTLHTAPLTHGAGFHAIAATARGAHQVIAPPGPFDPAATLALIDAAGVTNTWMVPTQIVMLTDAARASRPALPTLERIVYGGAAFAVPDLRDALEVLGPRLVQLYGQGETPMTATVLTPEDHAAALGGDHPERLASAGVARPGCDIRIFGADDEELPAGEVGELVVRGPSVMLGYWNRADATAETLRGGWLHTGDLGRIDEHGYLFLLDRAKDMIITGGSNVYAVEVEAVLTEDGTVRETAVVGVPDRTWGELVVAVVAPVDGASTEAVEAALRARCDAALAGYKRPRRYVFVDALPRNAYGKVVKRELRERLTTPTGA
ncbi:MAG TPA: AMP-binding protein [Mycobacteriales bacterium]|nr:AMP-binding protein [Mycobacteriales bacterium]